MEVEKVEAKVTEPIEAEEETLEMDLTNQEGDIERWMDEDSQYNRLEKENLKMECMMENTAPSFHKEQAEGLYDALSSQQEYYLDQDSEMLSNAYLLPAEMITRCPFQPSGGL